MSAFSDILSKSLPYRTAREDKLKGRLNHCYLVLTEDDDARKELCRMIAKVALCPHGGCGKCPVCEKIDDGAYVALSVTDKEDMTVADVEEIVEDSFFTSFDGDLKAYVVTNMQGMKVQAQNKFLKTLEEPSDGVVFILGATSPGAVLDTILSRCKKLPFEGFGTEELRSLLEEEVPTDVGGQESGLSRGDIINRAAVCAFGSCTRARALAADGEFARLFSLVADVLAKMTSTKKLDEQLARLAPDKNNIGKLLDMTETVLTLLLGTAEADGAAFGVLNELKGAFSTAALVNSIGLVTEAKKMAERNCNPLSVADELFMGILEVKYLCRR